MNLRLASLFTVVCAIVSTAFAETVKLPVSVDAQEKFIVFADVEAKSASRATVNWLINENKTKCELQFPLRAGRHIYNVDTGLRKDWKGQITSIALTLPDDAKAHRFDILDDCDGPSDAFISHVVVEDTLVRTGQRATLAVCIENTGGKDFPTGELLVELPNGAKFESDAFNLPIVPAMGSVVARIFFTSDAPIKGTAKVRLTKNSSPVTCEVEILPSLNLPKEEYVPEPKPVQSKYEIGAFYFPGWCSAERWQRVWKMLPERKPALGWYDEANPEVIDWQIKWAVENGISYFFVDWYWNKGFQHLDHWVKAFPNAKYKKHLKWAVMWANHTPKGSHSEEDMHNCAKFWIENYFCQNEYYRVNGKPVVAIWNSANMDRDLGEGGCKKLLDIARDEARKAGYSGIHFVVIKWPEADTTTATIGKYKERGFDETAIYHYISGGDVKPSNKRLSFDAVASSNPTFWQNLNKTGILPFRVAISTGWDDRPWNDHLEIYGRTPDKFKNICEKAKQFADTTGNNRILLGPLNEWGEGSYAEPNTEFGFEMYEAVREVFAEKPQTGWPLNFTPRDVGLGPYDLPEAKPSSMRWNFRDGVAHGWRSIMGIENLRLDGQGMTFKTNSGDPAIQRVFKPFRAKLYKELRIRMKASTKAQGSCQIFWSASSSFSERDSLRKTILADGIFHEYVFDLSAFPRWRGHIERIRFDPCTSSEAEISIETIELR